MAPLNAAGSEAAGPDRRYRTSTCFSVIGSAAAPRHFHRAPPFLRCEPPFTRGCFRSGRFAPLLAPRRLLWPWDETRARGLAVLRLRAMFAAVDQQHAVGTHPASGERDDPLLHVGRQRRLAHVEAELDRRRHLVDVLSAGPR